MARTQNNGYDVAVVVSTSRNPSLSKVKAASRMELTSVVPESPETMANDVTGQSAAVVVNRDSRKLRENVCLGTCCPLPNTTVSAAASTLVRV